jgi:small subunit ribosomal protein S2
MEIQANFIDIEELLEVGVHLGHKVSNWNPQMAPYIYGKHNQIHIINVKETIRELIRAMHFLEKLAMRGEYILLVGTKSQARNVVIEEAKRCQTPYVAEKWIGGALTNYVTVREGLKHLKELEKIEEDKSVEKLTKKEQAVFGREKRKLIRNLDGIRDMDKLPACLVVVDPVTEHIAVDEANKIGASVVALIDTNGNPNLVDIPIPCNDDSTRVIKILLGKLADAIISGHSKAIGKQEKIALPTTV